MDIFKNLDMEKLNKNLKILNSTGKLIKNVRNVQKILTIITLTFTGYRVLKALRANFR